MGQIYAIAGCSGVGKTTFLNALLSTGPDNLKLLSRTTGRAIRPNESEGSDYYYLPKTSFRQKIYASDFVHIEEYDNNYYGIDAMSINEVIRSNVDGIIIAGSRGADKLKATYGDKVTIIYLHTGTKDSLRDPRCLDSNFVDNVELRWRLIKKIEEGIFTNYDLGQMAVDEFVDNRMELNYLDLAFINGRIRSGDEICIIENLHDEIEDSVRQFMELRSKYSKSNLCFVIMPLREDLKPVYDDHISQVLDELGFRSTCPFGIFTNKAIMDEVLDTLKEARLIIADLTTTNPNVFYETGFCAGQGKEIILITQESEVPFDLRHIRHLHYEYTAPGMTNFKKNLKLTIKNVLAT